MLLIFSNTAAAFFSPRNIEVEGICFLSKDAWHWFCRGMDSTKERKGKKRSTRLTQKNKLEEVDLSRDSILVPCGKSKDNVYQRAEPFTVVIPALSDFQVTGRVSKDTNKKKHVCLSKKPEMKSLRERTEHPTMPFLATFHRKIFL